MGIKAEKPIRWCPDISIREPELLHIGVSYPQDINKLWINPCLYTTFLLSLHHNILWSLFFSRNGLTEPGSVHTQPFTVVLNRQLPAPVDDKMGLFIIGPLFGQFLQLLVSVIVF